MSKKQYDKLKNFYWGDNSRISLFFSTIFLVLFFLPSWVPEIACLESSLVMFAISQIMFFIGVAMPVSKEELSETSERGF